MIVWKSDDYNSVRRALLLDRDGVINERIVGGYVLHNRDLRLLPEFTNAVLPFVKARIPLIVVSNQACVGRELIDADGARSIMSDLAALLRQHGISIAGYLLCPHKREDNCACRKPAPGLLLTAAEIFDIALGQSPFIGDSPSDAEAGRAAGCPTYLVDPAQKSSYRTAFESAFGALGEKVTP